MDSELVRPTASHSEEHEAERRPLKRERIEASTPNKGEVEEAKTPGSILTPVAKKGRVQSDGSAILSEDEIEDSLIQKSKSTTTTPPPITKPTGLDSPSAPPTPYVLDKDGLSIKSENRETRHLRQRVEALECDDDGQALVTSATTESIVQDTEIADGQGENKESKDLELVDVVTEANGSEEKDMEVAEVAAEVAVTAELLIKQDEVANDIEFVDASKPVEEKVELVGIAQPQVSEHESPQETKPIASKSFSAFSSSTSPFSSVPISNASPFASTVTASLPPPPPIQVQKPKTTTSYAVPFVPLASNQSTPVLSRTSVTSQSSLPAPATPLFNPSTKSAIPTGIRPPPSTPATPLTRPPNAFASGPSPFSAFASSSGFGKTAISTNSTFGTPASKLSTLNSLDTPGGSSGFGSYSASATKTASSAFASVASTGESTSVDVSSESERKLGEPVEIDSSRRIFTEQEVVTGEEDEDTLHSVRCKLFAMTKTGWVERGTGVMKMNATKFSDETTAIPRLVMRADATHRLLLNATLFAAFSISISQEKYVCFTIIEDSEPISYMLRMAGAPGAQAFVNAVQERIQMIV